MSFSILSRIFLFSKPFVMVGLCCVFLGCSTADPIPSPPPSSPVISVPSSFTIVTMGDSLTEGYHLPNPQTESYPAQLEKLLQQKGYALKVENQGVSGDTTADGVRRSAWIAASHPQLLILFFGSNDALMGIPTTETKKNMEAMVKIFMDQGVPLLLIAAEAPSSMGDAYQTDFRKIFTDISQEYHIPLIPFPLRDILFQDDLVLEDGIHPNAKGYAKMGEKIIPFIENVSLFQKTRG